ncbi:PREDICTED: 7SK snRNA methylphosphate capping enzyme-like [Dinoponera quadriceps]|uniref:RNA methyltransferase n=1 Tax=Dinoponera quadriceps TaxID=609295 RepID=A0A6P3WPD5_DINQU|nr:PREDICTED: 7SK snRNA methylphosphate capping enzyme-like [Dinoponera quadriceps]
MSSVQVDRPTKMSHHPHSKKESDSNKSRKQFNLSYKKHNKHDDGRGGGIGGVGGSGSGGNSFTSFKFGRKRSQSNNSGKFFPPYKRRKKDGNNFIPPTKFLLGGNIHDPLNLNSMQDEEVNRAMNAVTPKSSPLPTPKHKKETIDVFPPNIEDPLRLRYDSEEYEQQCVCCPLRKASKRRNKKRKRACSSSTKEEITSETMEDKRLKESGEELCKIVESSTENPGERIQPMDSETAQDKNSTENKMESPQKDKSKGNVGKIGNKLEREDKNKLRLKGLEEPKDKRLRKDTKDKIVSPVIPQPGAWKPRAQHRPSQDKKKKHQQQAMPNFRQKDARYQYGNYNRYYGYRNPHYEMDPRLKAFSGRKELFLQKDILDIGCNIGHITLSVARDFGAKSVTGIDIDRTLINIARKNVKHYVNCVQSPASNEESDRRVSDSDANFFPKSLPINYGPIDIPGFTKHKQDMVFPYNVTFVQGNYVLDDDALLHAEQPQFDTILCLSITKWIHLNFGDAGLKQSFKRMYAQLRPGGVLILEPQAWNSYTKKKNLTERIYKNFRSIEFRPQNFTQYLLSSEIGFFKCEVVNIPPHPFRGFQRPIYLFEKKKEDEQSDDIMNKPDRHDMQKNEQLREEERMKYEYELFPKNASKGSMSEISHQSSDQYEQLENIYAPTATPCYDTPSYNNEQSRDGEFMCYDLIMPDKEETEYTKTHDNDKKLEDAGGETRDKVDKAAEENEETKEATEGVVDNETYNYDKQEEYSADKTDNDDKEMETEAEKTIDDACETYDDDQKTMGDEIIKASNS